jgi:hypothetical protein
MVRCFWCGAINDRASHECESCGRKLEWSNLLTELLKPSVGCLLGHVGQSNGKAEEWKVPTGVSSPAG